MMDIKVRDLDATNVISNENTLLTQTNEVNNTVKRIQFAKLLQNSISSDSKNALIIGFDGKLYANSGIVEYDEDYEFSLGQWTIYNDKFYKSLADNNIGNPVSDTNYWQEISMGDVDFADITGDPLDNENLSDLFDTKVNISADNFNQDGKTLLSSYALPSQRYIDLTLGASGAEYTPPANGWVVLEKGATGNQWVTIYSYNGTYSVYQMASNGTNATVFMPVLKDEPFSVYYILGGATYKFRFIYAEGDE